MTSQNGLIVNFTLAAANMDERDVLPELVEKKQGCVIAYKGLIRPELKSLLTSQNINLQTPLRMNMQRF